MMADDPQAECFTFRSNRFEDSLVCGLQGLLFDKDLIDVTFVCEGGECVKGHKVIFGACSSYFRTMFAENPCKHPIVVMPDVKINHFQAILEFVYMGEVNVKAPDTMEFLDTAEMLKIKGLTLLLQDDKGAVVVENVGTIPELAGEVVMGEAMEEVITSDGVPLGEEIPKLGTGLTKVEQVHLEMPKLERPDSTDTTMMDSSNDELSADEFFCENSKENIADHSLTEPDDPNVRRSHRKRIRSKRLPSPDMKLPGLPPPAKVKAETPNSSKDDIYGEMLLGNSIAATTLSEFKTSDMPFNKERNIYSVPATTPAIRRYGCQICGRTYSHSSHVARHHKKAHPNMPLLAPRQPGQAKMINTSDGEYSCHKCGKRFNRLRLLKQHVSVVHRKHQRLREPGTHKFSCPECGKSFDQQKSLKGHFRAVHTSMARESKSNLSNSSNQDDNENKTFKCPECPKTFARRNYISQHIKHSHREIYYEIDSIVGETKQGFKCPKCTKVFSMIRFLRSHYTVMHRYNSGSAAVKVEASSGKSSSQHKYKCPSCKKVFPSQHDVEEHFKDAHQVKRGATYEDNDASSSDSEEEASDNESKVRRYKCDACDRRFLLKVHLSNHMRAQHPSANREAGQYKCRKCNKSYHHPSHLLRHVNNIHGKYARKMVCKLCKKICMNLNSLRSHTFVNHPGYRVNKHDYE